MIAALPSGPIKRVLANYPDPELLRSRYWVRRFPLVWDWGLVLSENIGDLREHKDDLDAVKWGSSDSMLASKLQSTTRTWSVAHILLDLEKYDMAWVMLQRAAKSYGIALGGRPTKYSRCPNGCDAVVKKVPLSKKIKKD